MLKKKFYSLRKENDVCNRKLNQKLRKTNKKIIQEKNKWNVWMME